MLTPVLLTGQQALSELAPVGGAVRCEECPAARDECTMGCADKVAINTLDWGRLRAAISSLRSRIVSSHLSNYPGERKKNSNKIISLLLISLTWETIWKCGISTGFPVDFQSHEILPCLQCPPIPHLYKINMHILPAETFIDMAGMIYFQNDDWTSSYPIVLKAHS
jgi:hypothetical protein